MRISNLIEELKVIEKDYGNLPINAGAEDITLKVYNNTLEIVAIGCVMWKGGEQG